MVKFIDGFGDRRLVCRKCWGSLLENGAVKINEQKRLGEFGPNVYYNPKAIIRHFR